MSKQNKTQDADTSVTKSPKTIEVRLVVPYIILAIILAGMLGIVAGWFVHTHAVGEAARTVSSLK